MPKALAVASASSPSSRAAPAAAPKTEYTDGLW